MNARPMCESADMCEKNHLKSSASACAEKPAQRFHACPQRQEAIENLDGRPAFGEPTPQRVGGLKSDQHDRVPLVFDRVFQVMPHPAVFAHAAGGNHHERPFALVQLHALLRRLDVGQHGEIEQIPDPAAGLAVRRRRRARDIEKRLPSRGWPRGCRRRSASAAAFPLGPARAGNRRPAASGQD